MRPDNGTIPPPVGSGDIPQLYRLPGLKFQALCRDLFDREPGIRQCEEYGVNGQRQRGVDLLSHRGDGSLELGQTKAERDFTPAKIRAASDEFLLHWEYWKEKRVVRFIVFVASEVTQVQRQQEILKHKAQFEQIGITYELWSVNKVVNQLRPHPGIVSTHLGLGWVAYVCGTADTRANTMRLAAVTALNEKFATTFSEVTDERSARAKSLWQQGRRNEARDLLAKIKGDQASWLTLSREVQAGVLRLEASICLDSDQDPGRAEQLLSEATGLYANPEDDRIRASIFWNRGNYDDALRLLSQSEASGAAPQLALLLASLGRITEAEAALSAIKEQSGGDEQSAERLRIEALVNLCGGRVLQARSAILKAVEKVPTIANIRRTFAIVSYFSAVARQALPKSLPVWPEPVHWNFVLRDDESRSRLTAAAQEFRRLLADTEMDEQERRIFKTWYVASLSNHPDQQDLAQEELTRLLTEDPGNHRLLVWAVARYPGLDFPAAVEAARRAVIDGVADPETIVALAFYFISKNKLRKAYNLLLKTKPVFERKAASAIWAAWITQAAAMMSGADPARKIIESVTLSDAERRRLNASVLRLTGDVELKLIGHLEESYRATGDSRFLLDLVEFAVDRKQWSVAAEHCEQLANEIPTAAVLWLASGAAFRASRMHSCLRLLDRAQPLFPNSRLPFELRRLRIEAQSQVGLIPSAIAEAEQLANEDPTFDNLVALGGLYFSIGDHRSLCAVAQRTLRFEPPGSSQIYLRLAWQCQWEDRSLSVLLWQRAASIGLADGDVMPALLLGHNLGIEEQLKDLTHRMTTLGAKGEGGIHLATLDDIKSHSQTFQENARNAISLYERGQAALHVIAYPLHLTLAEVFHGNPTQARGSRFAWTAPTVLARSGSRLAPPSIDDLSWTVTADVSAILLAHHFGFLELVEKEFTPIRISPLLIPSLTAMLDRLTAPQAALLSGYRAILKALDDGRLAIGSGDVESVRSDIPAELTGAWSGLCQEAKAAGGYLVDFIPLLTETRTVQVSELPEDLRSVVIGQKSILRSLVKHGFLTEKEHFDLLERLPSIQQEPYQIVPAPNSRLFFCGTSIETPASVGAFESICQHFQVFVELQEITRLKAELRRHELRAQVGTWLRDLIARLSFGIHDGRYVLVSSADQTTEQQVPDNIDIAALRDLLAIHGSEGDRFWSDDRWINGHQHAGSMDIIDSVDVLSRLQRSGRITWPEYYEMVGRMRAEGVRFIPVTKDEILSALTRAQVEEDRLVEDSSLRNLRRGLAGSFLQSYLLQRPLADGDIIQGGELTFLIQSIRGFADALGALWTTLEEGTELRTKVRWLVESLYVDDQALKRIAGLASTAADGEYLTAIGIAGLISNAISMTGSSREPSAAKRYLDWVFRMFVAQRIHSEKDLISRVASATRRILHSLAPETLDDPMSQASALVLQRLLRDLPDPLRIEIGRDGQLMARLGLTTIDIVEVGSINFNKSDYLVAAQEAINGRAATLKAHDSNVSVEFKPGRSSRASFCFAHPASGNLIHVEDPVLGVLTETAEEREIVAAELVRRFDVPAVERADEIADLVSTSNLSARIEKAEQLRAESMSSFRAALSARVRSGDLRESDLVPKRFAALPRFMRVDPRHQFDSAATLLMYRELSKGEPIVEALDRLCRLPVELPDEVAADFQSQSGERQRALILQLMKRRHTPLLDMHLARLMTLSSSAPSSFRRLANCLLRRVLRGMNSEVRAYLAIVRWAETKTLISDGTDEWSSTFRLASSWILADIVYDCFRSESIASEWLVDTFSTWSSRTENVFDARAGLENDVAHPINIVPEVFSMCAVDYVFGHGVEASLGPGLREDVATMMLSKASGQAFPVIPLLPSPATATNQLGSFLARDRIAALLTAVKTIDREELRNAVERTPREQAALALETAGIDGWLVLGVVLGGFPPPKDLLMAVENAIQHTDFRTTEAHDLQRAAVALSVATGLVSALSPEAGAKLRDELIRFVRFAASRSNAAEIASVSPIILECALNITRARATTEERVADFGGLMAELALQWPKFGEEVRPIIQRLCEELPASQTPEIWRLNLRLRTQ